MKGLLYDAIRKRTPYKLRRWLKSQMWFLSLLKVTVGNEVYSDSYFARIEEIEGESVRHIAKWIQEQMQPTKIIDVGCGPGHLMHELQQQGVGVFGIDVSTAALKRIAEKGLPAEQFDLTTVDKELPGGPYDVAVCCEVAEHLDEQFASTLVDKLCAAAPCVFLTAAEPNKHDEHGYGLMHVNEQPNEYWIDLFEKAGYQLNEDLTQAARTTFKDKDVIDYLARPMVFHSARVDN